jgi:Protein of unknown function (DUF3995)
LGQEIYGRLAVVTTGGALPDRQRRWGYLAAAWCVLFAVLHMYWAVGGSVGLASSAGADLAARRPWWFVLGGLWAVALMLLVGAGFSIGLTRWRRRPGRVVAALGWFGGGLLLARGLVLEAALAIRASGLSAAVSGQEVRWSLLLWNPWFVVGGMVMLLATYQFARSRIPGSSGSPATH